jgi:glycosyltransferase involved in cell wall biosynthesis
MEKRLIGKADAIVTVNDSIADELQRRYGVEKPVVIKNVAEKTGDISPIDLRSRYDLKTKYILIFQGVLRPGQGLSRGLRAIAKRPDIGLVIVGDGPDRAEIEKNAGRLGIEERVRLIGRMPPEELINYTAGADAGFLLIEPSCMNSRLALPQKLFQYISAGVPPIVSDLPEMRKTVHGEKLGLVLDDGSADNDARAIGDFLQNKLEQSARACHIARGKYNWDIEGEKFVEIYRKLTND